MIELIFAVALVAGLGALFGGLKGARIAVGLVIVGLVIVLIVLAVAGIFGYAEYNDYQRTERQKAEVQRQAEQEKAEAQQQAAALSKTCREWEAKHPLGSPLDANWVPEDCQGTSEDAYRTAMEAYVASLPSCPYYSDIPEGAVIEGREGQLPSCVVRAVSRIAPTKHL